MMNEYFKFLDELRESGEINMFGAAMPLMDRFGISKMEAYAILEDWMNSKRNKDAD